MLRSWPFIFQIRNPVKQVCRRMDRISLSIRALSHTAFSRLHTLANSAQVIVQLIRHRSVCFRIPLMAASDLADRLQALQTKKKTEEFQNMSYQELADMRITFGETKVNQKFLEVIEGDPRYTQWFARKYRNSQKESHQAFLYFLQLYVERKELETSPKQSVMPQKGLCLKAKAKSRPSQMLPAETGSQGSWSESEMPWDVMNEESGAEIREELAETRRRMASMETTLAQITQHLRLLTQAAAAPVPDQ